MENGSFQTDRFVVPGGAQKRGAADEAYDWAESVVFALAVVVLVFTFLLRPIVVNGPSMENTLHNGDRVIITDLGYTPRQGNIIVLSTKAVEEPIIKRVIAVGGQTINIDYAKNQVLVDGKVFPAPIKEPMRAISSDGDGYGILPLPLKVPAGCVFVMGDNRNDSKDSRFTEVGIIQDKFIIGHAVFRILPFDSFGLLH